MSDDNTFPVPWNKGKQVSDLPGDSIVPVSCRTKWVPIDFFSNHSSVSFGHTTDDQQ